MLASGCDDYDDTELVNRVDGLEDRVTTLEEAIAQMNQDIKGVETLVNAIDGNVFVSKIETTEEGYTVYFTDGQKITISNGEKGEPGKDAPVVTVKLNPEDNQYYWAMTKDGVTDYILADGKPIPVKGEKGQTPMMRVTKEGSTGFWEVSYDGGKSWERVLDADGQPVTTSGGAGGLFTSATIETAEDGSQKAVFVLLNGEKIEIELRSEMCMTFKNGKPEGAVPFACGESKTYEFEVTGVLKTVVTKPDGWKSAYDSAKNTLTVTAPVEAIKDYAELKGEVSLIYFGKENQSAVITLEVLIGEFVKIDPEKLAVSALAEAGSYEVPFTADGEVTVDVPDPADKAWLTPAVVKAETPAEGAVLSGNIKIGVAANTGAPRTGKVVVAAADNTLEITVTQAEGVKLVPQGLRPDSGKLLWAKRLSELDPGVKNLVMGIGASGETVIVNVNNQNPLLLNRTTGELTGRLDLSTLPANAHNYLTTDDSGHVIFNNKAENGTPLTIYRMKDLKSAPEKFIEWTKNADNHGASVSVVGDVYGDALLSTVWAAWGSSTNVRSWNVKGGVPQNQDALWRQASGAGSFRNGDAIYKDLDINTSEYFGCGYDKDLLAWVGADNKLKASVTLPNGNSLAGALDIASINGGQYLAITADGYFDYAPSGEMWLLDVKDQSKFSGELTGSNSPAIVYTLPADKYGAFKNDGAAPAPYQDVFLQVSENGVYLYAYFVFCNGYVGCVQFDCLAQ